MFFIIEFIITLVFQKVYFMKQGGKNMKYFKVVVLSILCALVLMGCGKEDVKDISKKEDKKIENQKEVSVVESEEKDSELEEKAIITLGEYFQTIMSIKQVPENDMYVINGINWNQELSCGLWSEDSGVVIFEDYTFLYPLKNGFVASTYNAYNDSGYRTPYGCPLGIILDKDGKEIYKYEKNDEFYNMYVVNDERIFLLTAKTGFDGIEAKCGVLDNMGNWICPMQEHEFPNCTFEFSEDGKIWTASFITNSDGIVRDYNEDLYSAFTDRLLFTPTIPDETFYEWGGTISYCDSTEDAWELLDYIIATKEECIKNGLYNSIYEGMEEEAYCAGENLLCNIKRETIKMPEYFVGKGALYLKKGEKEYLFELNGNDGGTYLSTVGFDGTVHLEPFLIGNAGDNITILNKTEKYVVLEARHSNDTITDFVFDWTNGSKIAEVPIRMDSDTYVNNHAEIINEKYLVVDFGNMEQRNLRIFSLDGKEIK